VAVNPNTDLIYVPNSFDDTVSVIEDTVPPTPVLPTATCMPVHLTPTPHPGVGGKVLLPPAVVGAEANHTRTGSGEAHATWMALACAVAGTLAISGWCARRRWRKPRSAK
jgi:hypothetical protein